MGLQFGDDGLGIHVGSLLDLVRLFDADDNRSPGLVVVSVNRLDLAEVRYTLHYPASGVGTFGASTFHLRADDVGYEESD